MTIEEYQTEAYKTAIYPSDMKIIYPALGLVDECGEFLEKMFNPTFNIEEELKELGDILWYISALMTDLGLELNRLYITAYREPGDCMMDASKLCGKVKKWIRDSDRKVDEKLKDTLLPILQDVYNCVDTFCGEVQIPVEEVMQKNIDKLKSRQNRGVLQGNGDNR